MRYFTFDELSRTSLNINNKPNDELKANLEALVDNILDPLRLAYLKPIIVTSGYRSKEVNKVVGGSSTSLHLLGLAADIRTVEDTPTENKKLFDLIIDLGLPFDLLINEYNYNWIHVSYSDRHRRLIININ